MRDSILTYNNKKGDTLIVAIMYQGNASYTMTVNDELKEITANEEDVKEYISNFLKQTS